MTDDEATATGEAPIDAAVVERVGSEADVPVDDLTDALVELNAALIGRHSAFERDGDHVTVDGVRAYRVGGDEWASVVEEFSFDDDVATAVRRAHTEQARFAFASATDADEGFADGEVGAVVGVDTAEEF